MPAGRPADHLGPTGDVQALSYAAGILVTFAALAGVTIGLRAAGWGFQFQSPIFVTLIAWLLFAVALILVGAVDLQDGRWTGAGTEAGPTGVPAALSGVLLLGLAVWIARSGRNPGRIVAATRRKDHSGQPRIRRAVHREPSGRPARRRPTGLRQHDSGWCVTCLINERVALSPPAVRAAFAAQHVTYLLGDWTREDPAVTRFLQERGRDGVPLYMFYPAGGGAPLVLPQILPQATLLNALAPGG